MKKLPFSLTRLQLKKEKILALQPSEIARIMGGIDGGTTDDDIGDGPDTAFTYSLSHGQICKRSNAYHAYRNGYECGIRMTIIEDAK